MTFCQDLWGAVQGSTYRFRACLFIHDTILLAGKSDKARFVSRTSPEKRRTPCNCRSSSSDDGGCLARHTIVQGEKGHHKVEMNKAKQGLEDVGMRSSRNCTPEVTSPPRLNRPERGTM